MTTKLPTEDRPIRLDPGISEQVELLLDPYTGEVLNRARKAVLKVYRSGYSGGFADIVNQYREAIEAAVA